MLDSAVLPCSIFWILNSFIHSFPGVPCAVNLCYLCLPNNLLGFVVIDDAVGLLAVLVCCFEVAGTLLHVFHFEVNNIVNRFPVVDEPDLDVVIK